jgi:integrase
MSRSTLHKIKIVASMMYDYAMQNDIVTKNYAEFLRIPKISKEEKEIFSDIEIKKITDSSGVIEWVDTIMILIYTGLRISELLELTKFSIDLENKIITGGIKTDSGKNRTIPIHTKIYKYIKKWYDIGGDYLICNADKKGISSRKYREEYYMPALEGIGVRKLNPHSCRHTFASMLAKAGADTIAIQKIMGHSDYALTANVYTHTDYQELIKAMNLI